MISESTLKQIAKLFCGDTEGYYTYKSGPQLIDFFNTYYATADHYYNGFPSRWAYVYDKIAELLKADQLDGFFDIILSKEYLIREQSIGTVAAAEKSVEILEEIKRILQADQYTIVVKNGKYHMIEENKDYVLIGEGGFANVYKQNSTGLIKKQLKDEFLTDKSLRSRFKREFDITKSLQDLRGVIKVYSFSESDCFYTMEPADITLEKYVKTRNLSDDTKVLCIRKVLAIMSQVHARGVVHRDLSPNNIFVVSKQIKIADFGLGKDLNVQASHKTYLTRGVGQYDYCAPEQRSLLREGDKRSDVYSLGRVINFIMTGDPRNSHHAYRNVTEKATVEDPDYRFADASQLQEQFKKAVEFQSKKENKELIDNKIRAKIFDSDVENYICDMEQECISRYILEKKPGFAEALLVYMKKSESNAQHIIQSIDQTYQDICSRSFEAHDPFALFAESVLRGQYSFVVKETAAQILSYIAWSVNRYNAQGLVNGLIKDGIDPTLEEIIEG